MPNIHPFVVHFPIALLIVSVLADLMAVAIKRDTWHGTAWRLQGIGIASLLVAIATGLQAEAAVRIAEAALMTFELHEQLAFGASATFLAAFLWRTANRGKLLGSHGTGILILETVGMTLLCFAAWFGGELVFTYGVGVR